MSTVIRAADGLEFMLQGMYLYLEDTVTLEHAVTFEEATEAIVEAIKPYDPFHLALLPDKDGHFFFHRVEVDKASLPLEKRPFVAAPPAAVPCQPLAIAPGKPLYQISLALSDDKRATIGIAVSHAICDGRTLASYLAVVRSALPCTKKYPLPANAKLGEFDPLCYYTINPDECKSFPPSISGLPAHKILPPAEATVNMCEMSKFPLEPIRAYCKAHNVGIQAVLMAAMYRTFRIYGKVPADEALYGNVIVDTRFHATAKPELRERQFFCGANSCYAPVKGPINGDIDEDIRLCSDAARKAAATNDSVIFTVIAGQMINRDTLAFTLPSGLPDMTASPVFTGSNIGRVNCTEPRFMVHLPCTPAYTLPIYGVLSDTHLHTTLIYPEKINPELLELTRCQLKLVMDHVSSTK